jgi:hypothetical protein
LLRRIDHAEKVMWVKLRPHQTHASCVMMIVYRRLKAALAPG